MDSLWPVNLGFCMITKGKFLRAEAKKNDGKIYRIMLINLFWFADK